MRGKACGNDSANDACLGQTVEAVSHRTNPPRCGTAVLCLRGITLRHPREGGGGKFNLESENFCLFEVDGAALF
jgi:hypothetical protein